MIVRTVRTGRRVLATLVVVALTALGLAVIVPSLLGFHLYAIATGSMTGTLDVGTLAIAREVPVGELAAGDVITYVPPPDTGITHPVTHRIVDIDRQVEGLTTFVTRGDANLVDDPWTFSLAAPTQARVEHHLPHLGRPVLALTDPRTRLLALGIPAVAIALLSLRDLVAALRPTRPAPSPAHPAGSDRAAHPAGSGRSAAGHDRAATPLPPAPPVPVADHPRIVHVEPAAAVAAAHPDAR